MGNITVYTGGQTVTDATGTGERHFEQVDVLPGTPVPGIIYLTPAVISNSRVITSFTRTGGAASFGSAGGSFEVTVVGDEGANYQLLFASGASTTDAAMQTLPASGTNVHTIDVAGGYTGIGDTRTPRVTLIPNNMLVPETVLDSGAASVAVSVSQSGPAAITYLGSSAFVSATPAIGTNISIAARTLITANFTITTTNTSNTTTQVNISSPAGNLVFDDDLDITINNGGTWTKGITAGDPRGFLTLPAGGPTTFDVSIVFTIRDDGAFSATPGGTAFAGFGGGSPFAVSTSWPLIA